MLPDLDIILSAHVPAIDELSLSLSLSGYEVRQTPDYFRPRSRGYLEEEKGAGVTKPDE